MPGAGDVGENPVAGRGRIALAAGVAMLSVTVALVAIGVVLLFGGGGFGRIVWGLPGGPGLWALGFSAVGYPITRRHPANPVGWCLMVAGAAAGVMHLGLGVGAATADLGDLPAAVVNAWVVSVGALSSAVVLFPSGSPPSRWWRAQLVVLWGTGALVYFRDLNDASGFPGPLEWLDPIAAPAEAVFQLSLVAGFFSLVTRWRRSGSVERSQLKWVVYGVTLVGATGLLVAVGIANLAPAWYLPGTVVLSIAILAVPVTMGVAMMRHRLFDIDLVINRTLVYGVLTVSLALVYLGSVVSLQRTFVLLTGEGSQLTIVVSTLVIAALFGPLRRRIQSFIDRRFYRSKYDAAKTLEAFSKRLRNETNLETLGADLDRVVRETVHPAHVSVWLRPSGDESP